jgi:hypothetical protein
MSVRKTSQLRQNAVKIFLRANENSGIPARAAPPFTMATSLRYGKTQTFESDASPESGRTVVSVASLVFDVRQLVEVNRSNF